MKYAFVFVFILKILAKTFVKQRRGVGAGPCELVLLALFFQVDHTSHTTR